MPVAINEPIAFLVNEWALKIDANASMASGFLMDKSTGRVWTAEHFTERLLQDRVCKIFLFKGHLMYVWNGELDKTAGFEDASCVRITDRFRPDDLPEPYSISKQPISIGDTLVITGIHPHGRILTEWNAKNGIKDALIPILETHYQKNSRDPLKKRETVFHRIAGIAISVNHRIPASDYKELPTEKDIIRAKAVRYIVLNLFENHLGSVGGLSGSPVLRNGKIVAIVTAEKTDETEPIPGDPNSPLKFPSRKTVILTPVRSPGFRAFFSTIPLRKRDFYYFFHEL